jgi:hypothetical protein
VAVSALCWLYVRLSGRYRELLRAPAGTDLSELVTAALAQSRQAELRTEELDRKACQLDQELGPCLQRLGITRFDAYESVGGEMSFSIALLDREGTGVLLTSLYGREDSRIYAKALVKGVAQGPLSDDERRAVAAALQGALAKA